MVKMYKENISSFENITKYEKLIYSSTNQIYFKTYSRGDIEKDVFTIEWRVFYG